MPKAFDSLAFRTYLKVWRKMAGFAQSHVASSANIPTSTYNFIEHGDRLPTMAEFVALCKLVDADPVDFFVPEGRLKNG